MAAGFLLAFEERLMVNPLVIAQDVKKCYRLGQRDLWALKGVSFELLSGEFVALVGRSGSGKTTLLNLIGGLDTPTSGELGINGRNLSSLTDNELTRFRGRSIGYVFQTFNLIPVFSVLENVEYPLFHLSDVSGKERLERARKILNRVGLSEFLEQRPSQLSGGQRQRVAIARALVHNPALVMADEPTANLDSSTATEILDLMFELNRDFKQTIVVASHDPTVIKRAHRVIEISDGIIKI